MPITGWSARLAAVLVASGLVWVAAPGGVVAQAPWAGVRQVAIADLGGRPLNLRVAVGRVRVVGWEHPGVELETQAGTVDSGVEVEEAADEIRISQAGSTASGAAALVLRVPSALVARILVGAGHLELEGLAGDVQAFVGDGGVSAREMTGRFSLETTSGDLLAEHVVLPPTGSIKLRSFSGDIRLVLQAVPMDARFLAVSLRGRVDSGLPLLPRGGTRVHEAVFGLGDPVVSLDTVRGNISLEVGPKP